MNPFLPRWIRTLQKRLIQKEIDVKRLPKAKRSRPTLNLLEDRSLPSTFIVNITDNDGDGSLRKAIVDANSTPNVGGPDRIIFQIPSSGVHTIQPTTPLPAITESVIIDGYQQLDSKQSTNAAGQANNAVINIELDGSLAGSSASGLVLQANDITIQGLSINRFAQNGISISSVTGSHISGNFIGTDPTGTAGLGNGLNGVLISSGANHNFIGTDRDGVNDGAEGNVISGNIAQGIEVTDAGTSNNLVAGNLIGTNAAGAKAIGNTGWGVAIESAASSNTLDGNVISGNGVEANSIGGVRIFGTNTNNNSLIGNAIGVDVTGQSAVPNNYIGVFVTGGASFNSIGGIGAANRNVISGNNRSAVSIQTAGTNNNAVIGNYIGTDSKGAFAIANGRDGVQIAAGAQNTIIGGAVSGAGNLISGNSRYGIIVTNPDSSFNTIQGNLIGTTADGSKSIGNAQFGILVANAATKNTIGGTTDLARNVISGNVVDGVLITDAGTSNNTLIGNFIGTDITGKLSLPNQSNGLVIASSASNNTIGGTTPAERNVISGNLARPTDWGVLLQQTGTGNVVSGNYIGVDVTGNTGLPNGIGVVIYESPGNTIGGSVAGAGNIISGNTGYYDSGTLGNGIVVTGHGSVNNVIAGNLIGTDSTGANPITNNRGGITIFNGASQNTVGGSTKFTRNVISGNSGDGIIINGVNTNSNVVTGNYIGTDSTGSKRMANADDGIRIEFSAANNVVGGIATVPGTGLGNVISGNGSDGIQISVTSNNTVQGNLIGLDATGSYGITNGTPTSGSGIYVPFASGNLIGGSLPGAGNIISSSYYWGIHLEGGNQTSTHDNTVAGNRIGTNAAGTFAIPNGTGGLAITNGAFNNTIGGTATFAGNLISGNNGHGVYISGNNTNSNTVQGNQIGTNAAGDTAMRNIYSGMWIEKGASNNTIGGNTAQARNIISGNNWDGITITDVGTTGNKVQGNYIGTDKTGMKAISNTNNGFVIFNGPDNNLIGGKSSGERNVISGNRALPDTWGVSIYQPGLNNIISGNYIGVDATGTNALPNGLGVILYFAGNTTIGGVDSGAGNVISGNTGYLDANTPGNGVLIYGSTSVNDLIAGNIIGRDASNVNDIPNTTGGMTVLAGANHNTIQNNIIKGNAGTAVLISGTGTTSNAILGNSIGRSATSIGIDLTRTNTVAGDGPNTNDPGDTDTGSNDLTNSPTMNVAYSATGKTVVLGALDAKPNTTYRIELFSNPLGSNPAGAGELYLGFVNVTTDSLGHAEITANLSQTGMTGLSITATATDSNNNTSEFSPPTVVLVTSPPTAILGGPYVTTETTSIFLDASASSDLNQSSTSLVYAWDLDGDGIYGETGNAALHGNETGANPIFNVGNLDGPTTAPISLKVTNSAGLSSFVNGVVTITNRAPVQNGPQQIGALAPGESKNLTVNFLDVPTDPLTYFFDLNNDGTFDVTNTTGTVPVSFTTTGNHTVNVKVTDDDGGITLLPVNVEVDPFVGIQLQGNAYSYEAYTSYWNGSTYIYGYFVQTAYTNPTTLYEGTNLYNSANIILSLSQSSPIDIVVPVYFSGAYATPNSDFQLTNLPPNSTAYLQGFSYPIDIEALITIPAGQSSTHFSIQALDDTLPEGFEPINISLLPPTHALLDSANRSVHPNIYLPTTATTTIQPSDMPSVSFTTATGTMNETGGTTKLTAQLSQTVPYAVSIPLNYSSPNALVSPKDAATAGVDYQGPASIVIPANTLSASVTISAIGDSISEHNESYLVTMGSPVMNGTLVTGAYLSGTTTFTGTITDDDRPIVSFVKDSKYSLSTGYSVSESFGNYPITAQLSAASVDDVVIPLTYSGTATSGTGNDFTAPTSITIPAGKTSASFNIGVNNDTNVEVDETITVAMGKITNATAGTNLLMTIVDNDNPTVSIAAAKSSISEAAEYTTFTVSLNAATNHAVTVPITYAKTSSSGPAYTLSAGSSQVTIPAGSKTASVTITATNDTKLNGDQTVTATLGAPLNSAATLSTTKAASVKIVDDELPSVTISTSDSSVAESAGSITVTFSLNASVSHDVVIPLTVTGTAKSPSDYTLSTSSVTISAGNKTATTTIKVINDKIVESPANETVTLTMGKVTGAAIGAKKTYTLTIKDDDQSPSSNRIVDISITPQQAQSTPAPAVDPAIASLPSGSIPIDYNDVAIYLGGQVSGATIYFDANKDGILDYLDLNGNGLQDANEPSEVSTVTNAEGYYSLSIPADFDLNQDGLIESSEGQFVATGGIDSFTRQPVLSTRLAPVGSFAISAFSTLMTHLMNEQGLTFDSARQTVQSAFNLPDGNFISTNLIDQVQSGNLSATVEMNALAKLENVLDLGTSYVGSLPGTPTNDLTSQNIFSTLAAAIASPGTAIDLSNANDVDMILHGAIVDTGLPVSESALASVSGTIAGGNQNLDSVPMAANDLYLSQIAKSQAVSHGAVTTVLQNFAAGNIDSATLISSTTGNALNQLIAAAPLNDYVASPLVISDVQAVESDAGQTEYRFYVAPLHASLSTISVDYSTQDNTATLLDSDYQFASGTLTWAPGDTSAKLISVWVNGDTQFESDESFAVVLSNPVNAVLRKDYGIGTIVNNDALTYLAPSTDGLNQLVLSQDQNTLQLTRNGLVVLQANLTTPVPIHIQGADGVVDVLTIETSALPLIAGGLDFHGGIGSSDQLIVHDEPASVVSEMLTTSNSGQLNIAGSTVLFDGVESVRDGQVAFITGMPDAAVSEGTALTFSSVIPDALNANQVTYAWQVKRNGITVGTSSSPNLQLVPDDGNYEINLTIADSSGHTATTKATFIATNVAPIAQIGGPIDAVRGQARTYVLGAVDSPADQAAGFVMIVDWGDQLGLKTIPASANNGLGIQLYHVYTQSGQYTIILKVKDKDGALSVAAVRTVTVTNTAIQDDPLAPGQKMLVIGGSTGDDSIKINIEDDHHDCNDNDAEYMTIRVNEHDEDRRKVRGLYSLAVSRIVVFAQAGDDDVKMDDNSSIPAWIDGGDGDDRLKGGSGNDVLIGGNGDDLLSGDDGRDLMIGGMGKDRIIGNAGDDILIAGTTDYDANQAALAAIMAEWSRNNVSFAVRVDHLQNGNGLNGTIRLNDQTVHDDHDEDTLTGSDGSDWFLFNRDGDGGVKDKVADMSTFESTYAVDIDWLNH